MPDLSEEPTPPFAAKDEIVIDHPLYRHAAAVAAGVGVAAGAAIAIFASAPWWIPILAVLVIAAMVYRILRPRMRSPSIEDEI